MKLAIMQPYFMPYIGYFSLIKQTDEFILFDPVQFIRHGWIERNRTLKQNGGVQYVQIPLIKGDGHDTLIKDVKINNAEPWKQRMLAQLQHYKKKAPYYWKTIKILNEVFAEDYEDITHLNKKTLQVVCAYLGINREFPIFSEMGLEIEPVTSPDEWALNICKAVNKLGWGVTDYINPEGGVEFFDRKKYTDNGISLSFIHSLLPPYNQHQDTFEAGLSMIDILMFNSPEEINTMLDQFELL